MKPNERGNKRGWAGIILILVLIVGGGIWFRAAYQLRSARQFCESLIPKLEEVKARTGHYPERLQSDWWHGQELPELINIEDVYWTLSEGECYVFDFKDPYSFWTDRMHYNSQLKIWIGRDTRPKK